MFSATTNSGGTGQGRLRALRLSMNTPVVAIEELPVGPALAGVALREGPRGPSLCLAVRSVRTGHLVLFAPDDEWQAAEDPSLGMDAALSFAESMGFLFDEDLMAGGDPREGARRWAELLVEAVPPDTEGEERASSPPAPVLSKFRLRPQTLPVAQAPSSARDEVWLRLLSRF